MTFSAAEPVEGDVIEEIVLLAGRGVSCGVLIRRSVHYLRGAGDPRGSPGSLIILKWLFVEGHEIEGHDVVQNHEITGTCYIAVDFHFCTYETLICDAVSSCIGIAPYCTIAQLLLHTVAVRTVL